MDDTTARAIQALLEEEGIEDFRQSGSPRRLVIQLNENEDDDLGIITILLGEGRITVYTNVPVRLWRYSLGDPEVFGKVKARVDEIKRSVRPATQGYPENHDEPRNQRTARPSGPPSQLGADGL